MRNPDTIQSFAQEVMGEAVTLFLINSKHNWGRYSMGAILQMTFQVHFLVWTCYSGVCSQWLTTDNNTGDPLHSRALAHSHAPLFTQPCPHCSHSRAPGEQWARLCVFTLQGCVQAARLCRGSPVNKPLVVQIMAWYRISNNPLSEPMTVQFIDAHMRHSVSISWEIEHTD